MKIDPNTAMVLLVAFVVVSVILMTGALVGTCIYHSAALARGEWKCDADGKLTQIVLAVLVAAQAINRKPS